MAAGTKQPKSPLGREVSTLRRRANLTQRRLGALAQLSYTYLQFIELGERDGKPVNPTPNALRRIARGLAKDPIDGTVDAQKADEVYERLMRAAGYVSGDEAGEPAEQDVERYLVHVLGQRDGARVARIVQALPALDLASRRNAIAAIENTLAMAARASERDKPEPSADEAEPSADEPKPRARRRSPEEKMQSSPRKPDAQEP